MRLFKHDTIFVCAYGFIFLFCSHRSPVSNMNRNKNDGMNAADDLASTVLLFFFHALCSFTRDSCKKNGLSKHQKLALMKMINKREKIAILSISYHYPPNDPIYETTLHIIKL